MKLSALKQALALAPALGPAQPPSWFLIFPEGQVLIEADEPAVMDAAGAAGIMSAFAATSHDMVIDYEHQTLRGDKAPAAGWIKEFKWDAGLRARVEWTEIAAAYIKSREYRYFSPVFKVEKGSRRIVELYNIALTNQPRMQNIQALAAKLAPEGPGRKDNPMFEKLKKLLGLSDSAPEAEVAAKAEASLIELQTLKAQQPAPVVACKEVLESVGATDKDDTATVVAKINAFKAAAAGKSTADADFQALKADHENLKKTLALRDRDERVGKAIVDGKLTPAQKAWAETYALKDPAGFDEMIAVASKVIPLDPLPGKADDPAGGGTPDEKLVVLTAKAMKDNPKLGYPDAQNQVMKQNPELAQEYLKASRGAQV